MWMGVLEKTNGQRRKEHVASDSERNKNGGGGHFIGDPTKSSMCLSLESLTGNKISTEGIGIPLYGYLIYYYRRSDIGSTGSIHVYAGPCT